MRRRPVSRHLFVEVPVGVYLKGKGYKRRDPCEAVRRLYTLERTSLASSVTAIICARRIRGEAVTENHDAVLPDDHLADIVFPVSSHFDTLLVYASTTLHLPSNKNNNAYPLIAINPASDLRTHTGILRHFLAL
jgi:hypothetical protein